MPIIGGRQASVRGLGFQGAGAPAQVTGLTATNVGSGRAFNNGRIDLAWTAPATNGAPITGYFIERSTNGSTYSTLVSNTGNTNVSYSDTGLTSAQQYWYRVSAINAVGTGLASTAANATATTVPQAPTIGTATDGGTGTTVSVAFTGNSNGGSAITGYTATSSPGGFTGTGASSPITVSGLTAGTAYTFTVTATNANGTSTASAASNSVTPAVPGSFESIASLSPTSGTSATFSSIPSTYKNLQLRIKYMTTTGNNAVSVQFNGSSTASYVSNILEGNGSTVTAAFPFGGGTTSLQIMPSSNGTLADAPNIMILDIVDYQNTSKPKTTTLVGGKDNNGNSTASISWLGAGLWQDTAAISSITVSGPTFAAGTEISLYGIKG